jgi:outer membrane protein assembly factor BamA
VVTAESRWAPFPHVDGAIFFDAGSVAGRVKDLDFERTSAGFGFRVHTSFGRLNRRTAALPFVP